MFRGCKCFSDRGAIAPTEPTYISVCPHGLAPFSTPTARFGCNNCKHNMNMGEVAYGCRACDFDLCAECHQKQVVPAISEPQKEVIVPEWQTDDPASELLKQHQLLSVPEPRIDLSVPEKNDELPMHLRPSCPVEPGHVQKMSVACEGGAPIPRDFLIQHLAGLSDADVADLMVTVKTWHDIGNTDEVEAEKPVEAQLAGLSEVDRAELMAKVNTLREICQHDEAEKSTEAQSTSQRPSNTITEQRMSLSVLGPETTDN